MSIDFNHCLGASICGEELKKFMFDSINNWASSANAIKPLVVISGSLPIGLALAAVTLATKVATVGEVLIKSFANIFFGLANVEGFNAKLGAKQLFIALPSSIIDLLVGAPAHMLYNIVGDTIGISSKSSCEILGRLFKIAVPFHYAQERAAGHERKIKDLQASRYKSTVIPKTEQETLEKDTPIKEICALVYFVLTVAGNNVIYGDFLSFSKLLNSEE
ncbi:MAG: hypothetical protein H0T62_08050 [Parachlamydiaceae bacterium]|nr:hypothetical protein [Parachlamydiaceae bacterium]